MSAKTFHFHPEARAELREAVFWYRTRDIAIGIEFRHLVQDSVRQVAMAPRRWPEYLHGTRRYVLDRFPFSIIYLDMPEIVNIVAVAHSKRKPGYWKRRL